MTQLNHSSQPRSFSHFPVTIARFSETLLMLRNLDLRRPSLCHWGCSSLLHKQALLQVGFGSGLGFSCWLQGVLGETASRIERQVSRG